MNRLESFSVERETEIGIRKLLKNEAFFHTTIIRKNYNNMVGGLYKNEKEAITAADGLQNIEIAEIEENQKYKLFGSRHYEFTHGVDDGTHGSSNKACI